MRLVKKCVKHSKCKVKFNGELSKNFSVETGLRQGDHSVPIIIQHSPRISNERGT